MCASFRSFCGFLAVSDLDVVLGGNVIVLKLSSTVKWFEQLSFGALEVLE